MHEFDISLLEQYGKRVHITSATEAKLWIILFAVCVCMCVFAFLHFSLLARDSSIEMFCNNVFRVTERRYACIHGYRILACRFLSYILCSNTRDRANWRQTKRSERNERNVKRRSDKGHVWLITLIFKLIYKQFSSPSSSSSSSFLFCTEAMRHTRHFQLTSETSYLLSDRFAWAQICKWVAVALSTNRREKNEFIATCTGLSFSLSCWKKIDQTVNKARPADKRSDFSKIKIEVAEKMVYALPWCGNLQKPKRKIST